MGERGVELNTSMSALVDGCLPPRMNGMDKQGMCHRDLKLENLLLSGNPPKLKICDFGYSKSLKWQSKAKSKVGTAAYIAPEVITAQRGSNYNGNAVDVWSSGVVLHTMLAGMYPFCDPHMPNDEVCTLQNVRPFLHARGCACDVSCHSPVLITHAHRQPPRRRCI